MSVEEELGRIRNLLETKTAKAKVQRLGFQSGKPKLMIYITSLAKSLGIEKGDIVEIRIRKLGHEPCEGNRNKNWRKNLNIEEPKENKKTPDVVKESEETQDVELTENKDGTKEIKLESTHNLPKKEESYSKLNVAPEIYKGAEEFDAEDEKIKLPDTPKIAEDPEFEKWKGLYHHYKESKDSRLGPHILVGKSRFKKKIEEYLK